MPVALLGAGLATAALAGDGRPFPQAELTLETATGRHLLRLELACTPDARAHGLMGREEVPEGTGMLFDFGTTRRVAMWMKDTPHPLDMLFLDAAGRVRFVATDTVPFSLRTIEAPMPVRYVLELPAGSVARLGIAAGSGRLRLAGGRSPCRDATP